jgi:hypothetical protein
MLMYLHREYIMLFELFRCFPWTHDKLIFIWMFRSWDETSIFYRYTISKSSCQYDSHGTNRP